GQVVLGVQVQQRLLQRGQARDPHLRRRERVHPGDDSDATVVRVCLEAGASDCVRRGQYRAAGHPDRNRVRRGESVDDACRLFIAPASAAVTPVRTKRIIRVRMIGMPMSPAACWLSPMTWAFWPSRCRNSSAQVTTARTTNHTNCMGTPNQRPTSNLPTMLSV